MWQLADTRASFTLGPLSAQVNVAQPDLGIHALRIGSVPRSGTSLLCVRLPHDPRTHIELGETYVRASDLVATYQPLPPYTLQPQIYWRLRHDPQRAAYGIELILSMHTSQLYSEPQTPVSSQIAGVSAVTTWSRDGRPQLLSPGLTPISLRDRDGGMGLLAFEPAIGGHVYVEMIHPSDFGGLSIERTADGTCIAAVQVFQEHLEKGVIRRARACGWLLAQADWQTHAWELYQAFSAEQPPLTA